MTTHTPGPWVVVYGESGRPRGINAPNDKDIKGAVGHVVRWNGIGLPSSPTAKANARLIAAAPDLYEALRLAMPILERANALCTGGTAFIALARAAIAKAEGKP